MIVPLIISMKAFKRILGVSIIVLLLLVIILNVRLYYQPNFKTYKNLSINKDLIHQLSFLKAALGHGAAEEMQKIYPEGFAFFNVLYGLSWMEVAQALSPENELYEEALKEIQRSWLALNSIKGKEIFNPDLEPSYGIFYRGWTNYYLGRKLIVTDVSRRDSTEIMLFRNNCREIISALSKQESPFLQSYSESCWPADMVVAMASVKLHTELVDSSYERKLKIWIQKVKEKTDSLGLIPHSSEWKSGEPLENSRGSSQSLILNFLIEIDPTFAREQFKIYKNYFLDDRLGLPGIREYPKGVKKSGDIDSGPVLWGIGAAATLVGQRTMYLFGEQSIAIGIRNSIETFGFANTHDGKKSYLLGKYPMADVFIAWSNSVEVIHERRLYAAQNWRLKFQMISCVVLLLGGMVVVRIFRG